MLFLYEFMLTNVYVQNRKYRNVYSNSGKEGTGDVKDLSLGLSGSEFATLIIL
jgi:hypothetical protein